MLDCGLVHLDTELSLRSCLPRKVFQIHSVAISWGLVPLRELLGIQTWFPSASYKTSALLRPLGISPWSLFDIPIFLPVLSTISLVMYSPLIRLEEPLPSSIFAFGPAKIAKARKYERLYVTNGGQGTEKKILINRWKIHAATLVNINNKSSSHYIELGSLQSVFTNSLSFQPDNIINIREAGNASPWEGLLCNICLSPWCKCSHHGQFQTTNDLTIWISRYLTWESLWESGHR